MKYSCNVGSVLEMDPSVVKDTFGLAINSKTFSILIDGIYSHKIIAILRELGCNADDSHKEARNKNPFDVHLPTSTEPYFYIQDYGVGLSEEDVLNVYTNFFVSTKDTSNKYTGSLGLGSKVPMCYHTKSCTIEAVKDGTKLIYSCFLEDGIPSYAKMAEFSVNEPNGVKVQLPVSSNDFTAFAGDAQEVFQWFDTKPNFIGKQIDIQEPEKVVSGNGWFLSRGTAKLLMGNIAYDIKVAEDGLNKYSAYIRSPIVIEAKLGQVEFNSSREGLSYTKKTVAFLQMKYAEIQKELSSKIELQIAESKNYYEACCKMAIIHSNLPYHLKNIINFDLVKYNGKACIHNITRLDIDGVHLTKYTYCNWRSPKKNDTSSLGYNNNQLMLVDIKRGQHLRAKKFCQEQKKDVYLVDFDEEHHKDCKKLFNGEVGCDSSNYILESSISYVTNKPVNNANTLTATMKYNGRHMASKSWDSVVLDINKTKGVYVIRKSYQFHNTFTNTVEPSNLLNLYFPKLAEFGIKKFDIYAITKKDKEAFDKAGWLELGDYISEKLVENSEKVIDSLSEIDIHMLNSYVRLMSIVNTIPDLKNISDEYKKVLSYKVTKSVCFGGLNTLLTKKMFNIITKTKSSREKELQKLINKLDGLNEKYPLFCGSYHNADCIEELYFYYKGKNL